MPWNAAEGYFTTRGAYLPMSVTKKRHTNANLQILDFWNVYITKCIVAKKIDRVNLICLC